MSKRKSHIYEVITGALFIIVLCFASYAAAAFERTVLRGHVTDADGNAVMGAEIFVYDSPDRRRPADFISARTGFDGSFSVTVPAGTYWVVARLRSVEKFGPLLPGDKHSGEPVEIAIAAGELYEQDFTVIDIREAARLVQNKREDYIKLRGRIIDGKGEPVRMFYAIAHSEGKVTGVPDYLSGWTDSRGSYTLYLLPGTYYIGYAAQFPPRSGYGIVGKIDIETSKENYDITVNAGR